ncbi:MAG: hypothetical protein KF865_01955 [Bdellovibrionaceae bacterium]|nr:hypothetical protein [Pseudobdellovibrionaceae bacterium]
MKHLMLCLSLFTLAACASTPVPPVGKNDWKCQDHNAETALRCVPTAAETVNTHKGREPTAAEKLSRQTPARKKIVK